MKHSIKGPILLLITALFWGTTFVAQALGSDHIGAHTYNALRFLTAAVILGVITLIRKKKQKDNLQLVRKLDKSYKYIYVYAILVGVTLFLGSGLQQLGISETKSSLKSGFISTIYIVLVPVVSTIYGKRIKPIMILYIFIALLGSFLIAINEEFKLAYGDILTLICALFFAFQIVFVDHINPHIDSMYLTTIEFIVAGLISLIIGLIIEPITLNNLILGLPSIMYAAIFSGCIAYTLQIEGQRYTNSTLAAMIMSLESVVAMISGIIVLGEILTINIIIGSLLVISAIIFAQIEFPKRKNS